MGILSAGSDILKTYTIPILAIAGMGMAAVTVVKSSKPQIAQPPVSEPPSTPYSSSVAGSGIIEPSTQNISVGTPVPGVAVSVPVKAGDTVRAGDILFSLDDREIRATVAVREATLAARRATLQVTQAKLDALKAYPRPETIPASEAKVAEIRALLADAEDQLAKWEKADRRAVAEDVVNQKRFAVQTQRARLAAAEADLKLVQAGTFGPELDSAKAQIAEAESQVHAAQADVDAAKVEIDRRIVRAPIAGTVLQVNVRVGEFAQAGPLTTPLMIVGATTPLHIRVDVDENEAWRVEGGRSAVAFLRGNSQFESKLKFVRFEPYIVPKKSLTGESTERVDTRVLQIIFAVDDAKFPMYVGQQVDVYIDAPPRSTAKAAPTKAAAK